MSYTPGLQLPFGLQATNPTPEITWEGPYTDVNEANASVPMGVRYPGRRVTIWDGVKAKEFWWESGILDGDLVAKSGGVSLFDGNGLTFDTDHYNLGGEITNDVYLDGHHQLNIGVIEPLQFVSIRSGELDHSILTEFRAQSFSDHGYIAMNYYAPTLKSRVQVDQDGVHINAGTGLAGFFELTPSDAFLAANELTIMIAGYRGAAGQVLAGDGTGHVTWQDAGGGLANGSGLTFDTDHYNLGGVIISPTTLSYSGSDSEVNFNQSNDTFEVYMQNLSYDYSFISGDPTRVILDAYNTGYAANITLYVNNDDDDPALNGKIVTTSTRGVIIGRIGTDVDFHGAEYNEDFTLLFTHLSLVHRGYVDNQQLMGYTVATLPSASPAGRMIYVGDESGGAIPAFSDGANWRRMSDRAIIS